MTKTLLGGYNWYGRMVMMVAVFGMFCWRKQQQREHLLPEFENENDDDDDYDNENDDDHDDDDDALNVCWEVNALGGFSIL